jgi:hypothetical protein
MAGAELDVPANPSAAHLVEDEPEVFQPCSEPRDAVDREPCVSGSVSGVSGVGHGFLFVGRREG